MKRVIVVGVDGSAGSDAALRWALAEGRLRGARVRVVSAYQVPQLPVDGVAFGAPGVLTSASSSDEVDRLRVAAEDEAKRVSADALMRAGAAAEGIAAEPAALEGPPAETLIEAGRGAELLVVGSRGRGGFAGLLLGSVSQQCAQHPPCPVVILPPEESEPGQSSDHEN